MASADSLTVRVGRRVSTEAMAVHRQSLERLAEQLRRAHLELMRVDAITLTLPVTGSTAQRPIAEARATVQRGVRQLDVLTTSLRVAETSYSDAESLATSAIRLSDGWNAWFIGLLAPIAAWFLLPGLPGAALAGVWAANTPGITTRMTVLQRRLLNSPFGVNLVRRLVMSADDAVAGAMRVPLPIAGLLGDRGIGLTGVASTTGMLVVGANRAGMLQEAPVRIRSTTTTAVDPPRGLADRVQRIPHDGRSQVRVERYTDRDGTDRFEVYIGGTIDPSPVAGRQVLDMTSNAHGVAEASPASLRAVEQAMARAGVTAESPVVVTGYSQGGLVAALIAASGEYTVDSLIEVGAPSGQVAVPDQVPRLRLEHTSDLVTALGGDVRGEHTVRVQRDPLAEGLPDNGRMLPAHELSRYLETARIADGSVDERIREPVSALDAPLRSVGQGTSLLVRAERVIGGASG